MSVHSRLQGAMNAIGLAVPNPHPDVLVPCVWDSCEKINSLADDLSVLVDEPLTEEEEADGLDFLRLANRYMGSALVAAADLPPVDESEDIMSRLVCTFFCSLNLA